MTHYLKFKPPFTQTIKNKCFLFYYFFHSHPSALLLFLIVQSLLSPKLNIQVILYVQNKIINGTKTKYDVQEMLHNTNQYGSVLGKSFSFWAMLERSNSCKIKITYKLGHYEFNMMNSRN